MLSFLVQFRKFYMYCITYGSSIISHFCLLSVFILVRSRLCYMTHTQYLKLPASCNARASARPPMPPPTIPTSTARVLNVLARVEGIQSSGNLFEGTACTFEGTAPPSAVELGVAGTRLCSVSTRRNAACRKCISSANPTAILTRKL